MVKNFKIKLKMKTIIIIILLSLTSCVGYKGSIQEPNYNRISSYKKDIHQMKIVKKELKDSIKSINKSMFFRSKLNDSDLWNLHSFVYYNKYK